MTKKVRRINRAGAFQKEREENKDPVTISINTRVPSKWRFVDLETGDIWEWNGTFKSSNDGLVIVTVKKKI